MTYTFDYLDGLEFLYVQRTGNLYLADREDVRSLVARGYSGHGVGRNDPSFQDRIAEGPIPRGLWRLGSPTRHPKLGPVCIPLEAVTGTEVFGRSGFFIHGDSLSRPGRASTGCIVLSRKTRDFIARSGVRALSVIADE